MVAEKQQTADNSNEFKSETYPLENSLDHLRPIISANHSDLLIDRYKRLAASNLRCLIAEASTWGAYNWRSFQVESSN